MAAAVIFQRNTIANQRRCVKAAVSEVIAESLPARSVNRAALTAKASVRKLIEGSNGAGEMVSAPLITGDAAHCDIRVMGENQPSLLG